MRTVRSMIDNASTPDPVRVDIEVIGPMPVVLELAQHLWGPDEPFNSDGDCRTPDDTGWRRLTLALRVFDPQKGLYAEDDNQRLEIAPSPSGGDILSLKSCNDALLRRCLGFLEATGAVKPMD